MRKEAVRAVLDAALVIAEIPAAARPQRVERTPAEEAVEILRIRARVAGKEFTFPVREILIVFCGRSLVAVFSHGGFPLSDGASGRSLRTKPKRARGLPVMKESGPPGNPAAGGYALIYYLTSLL